MGLLGEEAREVTKMEPKMCSATTECFISSSASPICFGEIEVGLRLSLRFFSPTFRRRRFPGTKDGLLLGSTSLLLFGES